MGGLITLTQNPLGGILFILLGPIVIRVYAEIVIVLFEINAALQDLRSVALRGAGVAPPTPASAPPTFPAR